MMPGLYGPTGLAEPGKTTWRSAAKRLDTVSRRVVILRKIREVYRKSGKSSKNQRVVNLLSTAH